MQFHDGIKKHRVLQITENQHYAFWDALGTLKVMHPGVLFSI